MHVQVGMKSVVVHAFSDASHAPYRFNARRSITGGAIFAEGTLIKTTAKQQQSVASMLCRSHKKPVSFVALDVSKAMHEFLVLHYMATDSAEEWDAFLDLCLPHCTWIRAGWRRALALHMYDKCHVATSHRRLAHPSWIASMKLMLDLLLGARQNRYLRSRPFDNLPAQVYVRGFSAGSYSGICLLHMFQVYWVALLFLRYYCMGSCPTTVPSSW